MENNYLITGLLIFFGVMALIFLYALIYHNGSKFDKWMQGASVVLFSVAIGAFWGVNHMEDKLQNAFESGKQLGRLEGEKKDSSESYKNRLRSSSVLFKGNDIIRKPYVKVKLGESGKLVAWSGDPSTSKVIEELNSKKENEQD